MTILHKVVDAAAWAAFKEFNFQIGEKEDKRNFEQGKSFYTAIALNTLIAAFKTFKEQQDLLGEDFEETLRSSLSEIASIAESLKKPN